MRCQLAACGSAVEEQHVHPESAEPHSLAVDDTEQAQGFALDPGLLVHLFHRHLGRRVAHVGPSGWIQPDARVLALHQQDLTIVVANDRSDGHLGRDVSRHTFTDRLQPLLHEMVGLALHGDGLVFEFAGSCDLVRSGLDVGRDVQDLLVALTLVQVLGETHPGTGYRCE